MSPGPLRPRLVRRFLFAGLAMLLFPALAPAWWNGEWTIRKKVTLDLGPNGAAVADNSGAATVLVRLHEGNFQFAAAREDGGDLRFVAADDKTVLAHHLERYDSLLNEAFVWVRVPDVKGGTAVTFWMYYGNAGPKGMKSEDAKATWDADTVLAWHFGENRTPAQDSTGTGNTATSAGPPAAGSLIGGGLRLSGRDGVGLPASPSLDWTAGGALTWSLWVKPAAANATGTLFVRRGGDTAFIIGVENGVPYVEVGGNRSAAAVPLPPNAWRHLAVTAGGGTITLYVNGEPQGTLTAPLPALDGPATLGAKAGAPGFAGEVDELEISRVARTPGWLKLGVATQGGEKDGRALAFAPDEQQTSWFSGGTLGVIVSSLTFDGWVVIGILAVMAVVSWWIMITKFGYLSANKKGNGVFLLAWNELAGDLAALDGADAEKVRSVGGHVPPAAQKALRRASIFNLYRIGVDEVHRRVGNGNGQKADPGVTVVPGTTGHAAPRLESRSIQAVRASLDGGLVRETQKLNRLMVLLTICISGGPFLGLLGTVVGVMITFAAIAAAGDVNVNAIAPGIAAALLATIAGLAVAIPALFGYNYLVSRVKELTADMQVFVDEFVTRMAEYHDGNRRA